jgi:glycosyltransferase involved in cell wall biosynthesis
MSSGRRRRIAVFGTFYPVHQYAGCSTTGIVLALAIGGRTDRITVYCQRGARLPPSVSADRVVLRPVWSQDDPGSLLRALLEILRDRQEFDLLLVNTYVTAFGRRSASNVAGMLLPTLAAVGGRRPVTTYLHNLVETQDVEALGYSPGRFARAVARALEWGVLRSGTAVVPLEHQARRIRTVFGTPVTSLLLPYVEGVASVLALPTDRAVDLGPADAPTRLLIFGSIGPQKDIVGVLRRLDGLAQRAGRTAVVTLAGTVNPRFPDARKELDQLLPQLRSLSVVQAGPVSEDEVVPFLLRHDAVLLPYHATGGISGVLNLAALAGLDVIAYDHPQLREQAERLGVPVHFVDPDSDASIVAALRPERGRLGDRRVSDPERLRMRVGVTVSAVDALIQLAPGGPVTSR